MNSLSLVLKSLKKKQPTRSSRRSYRFNSSQGISWRWTRSSECFHDTLVSCRWFLDFVHAQHPEDVFLGLVRCHPCRHVLQSVPAGMSVFFLRREPNTSTTTSSLPGIGAVRLRSYELPLSSCETSRAVSLRFAAEIVARLGHPPERYRYNGCEACKDCLVSADDQQALTQTFFQPWVLR